jgi:hypothetical protein
MPSRQDEVFQRWQPSVHLVHAPFQQLDVSRLHPFDHRRLPGLHGQRCADAEQQILYFFDLLLNRRIFHSIPKQPHVGIEFVNSSIRFNAEVTFGQAFAAKEGSFAGVACFCINFERHVELLVGTKLR